jgi:hypothetical protein
MSRVWSLIKDCKSTDEFKLPRENKLKQVRTGSREKCVTIFQLRDPQIWFLLITTLIFSI